jgi:membrane protease YdiL (CAAX protease family)
MPNHALYEKALSGLAAWGALALVCAGLGCGLWFWLKRGRRGLFPPQHMRAVPWTGADVAFLFFLSVIVWPGVVTLLLARVGFFEWMYGPAPPGELPESVKFKQSLWTNVFAFPLDVATILGFLRLSSQARLYHLGLTCHRGLQNVLLSLVAWATVTPGIYLLAFVVDVGSERILHQAPEEHPLIKLAQERPGPAELAAIAFAAIIAAPIREELLFRGVLQRWCTVRAWGSDVVLAAALTLAWLEGASKGLWPVLFVLAMIPGYVLVSRSPSRLVSNPDAARAIYASALLFAAFHSQVWPTPVPLFALGLVLGFLAHRTQSLLPSMLLHGLFNAVATLSILYTLWTGSDGAKGNEATTALLRSPATSISTGVPGVSLPRRTYPRAIVPYNGDRADEVTCPISLPARNSFDPGGKAESPSVLSPTSSRFTCPYVRMRAIVSCPM